jgi:HPt (histidine-containing phosphotransfer) domain-containing protein
LAEYGHAKFCCVLTDFTDFTDEFPAENEIVEAIEAIPALDREQLRDVTMDDEDFMREVWSVMWDDAPAQVPKLEAAVRNRDQEQCVRLAHYSRGAGANVGANAAARVFRRIEEEARAAEFRRCEESLAALGAALLDLQTEIAVFRTV